MRVRWLLGVVVYPSFIAGVSLLGCASSPGSGQVSTSTAGQTSAGGSAAGSAGAGVAGSVSGAGTVGSAGSAGTGGTDVAGTGGATAGAAGSSAGDANSAGSSGAGGSAGGAFGGGAGTAGSAGAGGADDGSTRPGWTLVWRDEFDGPKGSAPDPTKWTPQVGQSATNKELEYYTARPENLSVDGNGFLVMTARKESYLGSAYTSSRMDTKGKFEQAYGRFESRIKIPHTQSLWPAFWIMGSNNDTMLWPACGELDIMENRGKEPTISLGAMHGPGYSGSMDFRAEHVIAEGVWQNFHTFAVEWEPNVVRWYVDDELFETRTPTDLAGRPGGLKWVYDHPFFIIMNVAVGGLFPGNPDATTVLPQTLTADYVRVYKRP